MLPSRTVRHLSCDTNRTIALAAALLFLLLAGCGGGNSTPPPTPGNSVPSIASLSPSVTTVGAASQTVSIQGSNFLSSSTVTYNGQTHSANFVSSSQLTISLSASDQTTAGAYPVVVTNPPPGGGSSNSVNFAVNNPEPVLNSVSPPVLTAGSSDTLITMVGTNFVAQSNVKLNGAALATTFGSSTQLSATVPAGSLASSGISKISVTNPTPGGGDSAALNLVVTEPLPEGVSGPLILSIPPSAGLAGKPLQHQVIGSSANPSTLTFSLSTAPAGMSINGTTGLLQWTPGSNQVGDQPVTIVAQDSAGQSAQSFTLSVFGSRPVASAKISASSGGVIAVTDSSSKVNGLSISIPAGALSADTTITVSELSSPPTLGGTPHFLLKGFSVEPDGTQLAHPAQVTIPYSTSEFGTSQGMTLEEFLGVYFVDTASGSLGLLSNFTANKVNHVLTGTVSHFSVYVGSNKAQLCPPLSSSQQLPLARDACPNEYAAPLPSVPAVLIHGYQLQKGCPAFADETTWGDLRYFLKQDPIGIDAWRFDWDSVCTPFAKAAFDLNAALQCIEAGQSRDANCRFAGLGPAPHLVNLVAHSFGGIVARTYVEGLANDADLPAIINTYRGDINRLMTLGTPHSGIGGDFSLLYANTCLALIPPQISRTCQDAKRDGALMNALNSTPLPKLNAALTPQYDLIAGKRINCFGVCALLPDDGLIATAGNQLCGTLPGGGTGFPNECTNASVKEEVNPYDNPKETGLCHTQFLISLTICHDNNKAMVAVDSMTHPLWTKICKFLGGCSARHTLTVMSTMSTNPSSGAHFSVSPVDNNGNGDGLTPFTLTYNDGAVLNLTADQVIGGNSFSGWSGCDSTSSTTCTVTMNGDRSVMVNYVTVPPVSLTVASSNPGSGVDITVNPPDNSSQASGLTQFTLSYTSGTQVTLTAQSTAAGNNFSNWSGCDNAASTTCTVTMNSNRTVIANYSVPGTSALVVASTNPSTGVAVSVSPADNSGNSGGNTLFTRTYTNGTTVTLNVLQPTLNGTNFSSWTGCDSSSGTSCTATMATENRMVIANYGSMLTPACVYVANLGLAAAGNNVSAYRVDPTTGALTSVGSFQVGDLSGPRALAADPSGRFLYVAASLGFIAGYPIQPDCAIGQQFTVATPPASGPESVAVHPSGKFLYAIYSLSGGGAVYTIDPNSGALQQTSTFETGQVPLWITIDAQGHFAYVANLFSNNVSGYDIDSTTGALTPIVGPPPSPYPTETLPVSAGLDPTSRFTYVANYLATDSTSSDISAYAVDPATGALNAISGSPFGAGRFIFYLGDLPASSTTPIVVHPNGVWVYVAATDITSSTAVGAVFIFGLDPLTGALSPKQVGPFAAGQDPAAIALDPSGHFLYVANFTSSTVSAYAIDQSTGALAPIQNSATQTGPGPSAVIVTGKKPAP